MSFDDPNDSIKIFVLVTDKVNVLAVESPSGISLIRETLWPIRQKKPKNKFVQFLAEHAVYHTRRFPVTMRQQKIFGLDDTWYVIEVDNVDEIVKNAQRISKWFYRNTGATNHWKCRSITLLQVKTLCDAKSFYCVTDYFERQC